MPEKTHYMAQAKAQMDAWTHEMKKMQTKLLEAGVKNQDQMQKQMEDLKEQRDHLQKQMEDLAAANMDAMKEIQTTMQSAWQDMEKSMEATRKKFMGG